jgi:hypothetical protein
VIIVVEALEPVCCDVDALAPPDDGVDALVEGLAELPQAAISAAAPTRTGAAHHRLRMAKSPFLIA